MEPIRTLPGYEIVDCIARGDMSSVWLARQVSLDRYVAIKVLNPSLLQDSEARERFKAEARAAAKINHPGIVQVYDAGEHEGLVYFVMEYVPGCAVSDLLKRGKVLSERNALLIAQGVAYALEYAWSEAQLVHCDIKPDNILIAEDGTVKVADLGLARTMGTLLPLDTIEATPYYCSPEQAQGQTQLDCRSDIYSLGATLYHMTTGRIPFGESSPLDALERHVRDFLPDPVDLNSSLSAGFGWLVEKCMMKDPSLRYPSWGAFLIDMERVLQGHWPQELPPAGRSTILRSEKRLVPPPPVESPAQTRVPVLDVAGPTAPTTTEVGQVAKKKLTVRKITIPQSVRFVRRAESGTEGVNLAQEWAYLLSALVTAFALYGGIALFFALGYADKLSSSKADAMQMDRRMETEYRIRPLATQPVLGERSKSNPSENVESRKVASLTNGTPAFSGTVAQNGQPSSDPVIHAESWSHPEFVAAAKLFNEAVKDYAAYQKNRQDPTVLNSIEQRCRQAVTTFERLRSEAPADIDMDRIIRQCYQLISDVRQSTLLRAGTKASQEPLSPVAQRAEEERRDAPRLTNLSLHPSWNNPEPGADAQVLNDLARVLRRAASPKVQTGGDPSIVLWGAVYYLMPLEEATKLAGRPVELRKRIATSGFPLNSFYASTFSGNFGEGFERLTLITDTADRVVGVQVWNEKSDENIARDPSTFSTHWVVYDFVGPRKKTNPKWKIAHEVSKKDRVVQIDSELVSHDPRGYFELGDSKFRSRLYLAEPVADLILARVEKLLNSLPR